LLDIASLKVKRKRKDKKSEMKQSYKGYKGYKTKAFSPEVKRKLLKKTISA